MIWNHLIFNKTFCNPFPHILQYSLLWDFKIKFFSEELKWPVLVQFIFIIFTIWFSNNWWKYSPWAIKENIGGKLFLTFVFTNTRSMNSYNISNSLGYWQIFKSICKQNKDAVINASSFFIDGTALICNLHWA